MHWRTVVEFLIFDLLKDFIPAEFPERGSFIVHAEGFRLGQAHIDLKFMKEGTVIAVMQGAGEALVKASPRPKSQVEVESAVSAAGGKTRPPEAATVVSRFPKKK